MLVNEIPKEKIKFCIEKLHTMFQPHNAEDVKKLKQALTLFRNGAVYNAVYEDEAISAIVQENGNTYEVKLELDFMEISYCSCDESQFMFCVHQIATLFYLFSLFDSPGNFFNKWKDRDKKPFEEKIVQVKKSIFIEQKEPSFKEDSLESWLGYFDERYQKFRKKHDQRMMTYWNYNRYSNLAESIFEDYYPAILDTPMPSSPFGEILFRIHAALTAIMKILESESDGYSSMYAHSSKSKYISELISDAVELTISTVNHKAKPTAADEKIISATPDRLLELLFVTRDYQYDRNYLFQIITANLLHQKQVLAKLERKLLARYQKEEKLKQLGKSNFSSECRLALAHIDFMHHDDQKALERLREGPANEVYFYTTWFKALAGNKIWDRFEIWLAFVEERMDTYIHQYGEQQVKRNLTNFFLFYIREYANEKGTEAIYINTLQTWLPYSYADFCEYLLFEKEYRKWTELQLFAGISIENLDRELLKEIEQHDRSCLLPLYHHAAEEAIALKSRDAYRQAVKYLRKLRTHYRALKKEERWNHYIQMLSQKYKRLRAFQEELRKGKGKLIND